jgi:HD-GYP domain-containing protein (c-di-GMP phosphodiesterase class II)
MMVPLFGVLAVLASERRVRLAELTELNGAYRGTAMVPAEVVDADDAYTGMHTRDVVALSVAVAERMGSTRSAAARSSSARCCTMSARS